jgi:cytoskeleton protein RodZ
MAQIVSPVPDRLEQLLNARDAMSPPGGFSTPVDHTPAPYFVPMVPVAPHSAPSREIVIATPSAGGGSAAERDGASPHATQPVLPLPPSAPSPSDTTTRDEPTAPGKVARPIETASTINERTGGQSGVTAMAAEPPNGIGPLASPGLKLLTGNAGGLVVMVDGQVAPPLGKDGIVRRGIALDPDSLRKGTEGSSPR